MSSVAIVTNIPSPYRVDLFYYLQTHVKEYTFHVIYTSKNEDNRQWGVAEEKLLNTHFLDARVIKLVQKMDNKYIHLPANIGKVLDSIKPDAVIASEYNPAALQALFWAKSHRKKFIHWTDGTLHSERNIGKAQKLMRKLICGSADACIASSTKSKEKLLFWGVPEEKIFVSLLTVDITPYRNLERTPIPGRLLYVGSMIPRKGLDLLIDALPRVQADVDFRIVGNGTEDQIRILKRAAMEKGVADKLTFCGFKQGEELLDEYRKAQVFVLPTREDCFGLVLLEAMCAGVPIVASKYADGAYDIVEEGRNGFIVDPYSPMELAQAIDRAMNEHEKLIANREQIERFAFENVSTAYENAVDHALQNR